MLICMLQKYVVDVAVACTWNLTGAELDGAAGSPLLAGAGVVDVKGLVGWASVAPGLEAVERLRLDQNAAAEPDQQARSCPPVAPW